MLQLECKKVTTKQQISNISDDDEQAFEEFSLTLGVFSTYYVL